MKKILSILAGVTMLTCAGAQTTIVDVPAVTTDIHGQDTLWKDTGLYVTNGEIIRINANGLWSIQGGVNASPYDPADQSADGSGGTPEPDCFFANGLDGNLIAYIGTDPTLGHWPAAPNPPTPYFFPITNGYWQVGTSVQIAANTGGELWLGFNDDAEQNDTGDNNGHQTAEIFLNNATNNITTNNAPTLYGGNFTGYGNDVFSFSVTNGPPYSYWAVYDSSDATNWVLIGSLALNTNGLGTFINDSAAVSRRYYKLDNGICHSLPYGFQIFNVQFSYSGSPQQIWSDSFNVNGYWNVVQGASFDDNDNPIYPTFGGAFDGQAVNEATLFDGSGSFSAIGLVVLANSPGSGEPPVIFHNSISPGTDPLSENVLCVTSGVDYEMVLNLDPVSLSLPPVVFNVNFFSYNTPADSLTTFTPTHYGGPFSVSLPSSQTASDSSTSPYVSFNGLAAGTWIFDLSGTELGPCCNGLQIIAIGRPLPLY